MAIDTLEKRRSVSGIQVTLMPCPTPSITKSFPWRRASGWGYSGYEFVPITNYQVVDGKGKRKRRNKTNELFDSIEETLYRILHPEPEAIVKKVVKAPVYDVDEALRQLTLLSSGYTDLSAKVAQIRLDVAKYEAAVNKAREDKLDEENDEFMMLF